MAVDSHFFSPNEPNLRRVSTTDGVVVSRRPKQITTKQSAADSEEAAGSEPDLLLECTTIMHNGASSSAFLNTSPSVPTG